MYLLHAEGAQDKRGRQSPTGRPRTPGKPGIPCKEAIQSRRISETTAAPEAAPVRAWPSTQYDAKTELLHRIDRELGKPTSARAQNQGLP